MDRKLYITLKSLRQTFWARFLMITSKMWPLEHQQGFPLIWPGELVFDIKWPSFKLDLEIIKTNILSNIYDDYLKNVTSGVLTVFCRFGQVTQFLTPCDPVSNLTWKSSRQTFWARFMMIASKMWPVVLTRFSADLARWPSFWSQVTQFQTWPRNHQDNYVEQDSWWLLEKCDH